MLFAMFELNLWRNEAAAQQDQIRTIESWSPWRQSGCRDLGRAIRIVAQILADHSCSNHLDWRRGPESMIQTAIRRVRLVRRTFTSPPCREEL